MNSYTPTEDMEISIKNNFFADETNLTIFSEDHLNQPLKIMTQRDQSPYSKIFVFLNNFKNLKDLQVILHRI